MQTSSVTSRRPGVEGHLGSLSKVPEVTLYFWVIKVLCTTVGETAADFLNVNLNFGLTGTSIITGILLAIALVFQFRTDRYRPAIYWLSVALISVFGTLVTDNLSDKAHVRLETSTMIFSGLLALTFLVWYGIEKTLDIHFIFTARREAFYWLAVLFSFALGTATGDLMAETLGIGYFTTGIIVIIVITIATIARRLGLNSVLAFWIVYILTRPLGASIGDYLSQSREYGGLGLGATVTSALFLLGILATVVYLSVTKADVTKDESGNPAVATKVGVGTERGGLLQTGIVVVVVLATAIPGYQLRKASLADASVDTVAPAVSTPSDTAVQVPAGGSPISGPQPTTAGQTTVASQPAAPASKLGDLSKFRTIAQGTLDLLNANNQSGATNRIADLEHEWDTSQARLKPRDGTKWTEIDGRIDTVLRELRAVNPSSDSEKAALSELLAVLT